MTSEFKTMEPTSPILTALWQGHWERTAWQIETPAVNGALDQVMTQSIAILRQARREQRLHDAEQKLSEQVVQELAQVGYWGAMVPTEFGGSAGNLAQLVPWLTRVARLDPTVAGLLAVHSCIGPVNQLVHFGTLEQQQRLLPALASGQRLGVFGLTEPNAGSDLTALRTTAQRDGNDYVLHGEKLFLTNLLPGRTVGVVCRCEDQTAVLLVELPEHENEQFQLVRYGLHSLQHAHNHGCRFQGLRVPVANRLTAPRGDGLQIAYHGLNRGRVALCANAAGTLRVMLANLLPWSEFRRTYGQAIKSYQLVARRIGRMAGLIVGCDLLANWTAGLLCQGQRGELEAIIAKTWAADALREAAIEIVMRTHGGRAFLAGHHWGDHLHDYLAPSIYEGENEVLLLALFKGLVKPRVKQLMGHGPNVIVSLAPEELCLALPDTERTAWEQLRQDIDQAIAQHGQQLAHEQLLMLSLAQRCRAIVMRTLAMTCLTTVDQDSIHAAALGCLLDPSGEVALGQRIVQQGWSELEDCAIQPICQPYTNNS